LDPVEMGPARRTVCGPGAYRCGKFITFLEKCLGAPRHPASM
jgi:hypothetical protein